MEWTGFTDEQLRRLKSGSEPDSRGSNPPFKRAHENHSRHDRPQTTRPPPQRGRGPPPPPAPQNPAHRTEPPPLDHGQMLSQPKQLPRQTRQRTNQRPAPAEALGPDGATSNRRADRTGPSPQGDQSDAASRERERTNSGQGPGPPEGEATNEGSARAPIRKELDEKEGLSRELSKLEEFQQRQKEIEDENHRKKNLLAMAIADRKKKTQAEVKRLAFIQKELSRIEEFLTTDVNILRDKIEEASRHYSEAQKRYQKAEAEFVTAKVNLHKASDRKEALTEHLCTIIRENELRKAKKLEELVEKLDADNLAVYEVEMEVAKEAERQICPPSPLDDAEPDGPNPPTESVLRESVPSRVVSVAEASQVRKSTDLTPGEETRPPQGQGSVPAVSPQGQSSSSLTPGDRVGTQQEGAEAVSTSGPDLETRSADLDMKRLSASGALNNNLTPESRENQT